MNNEVLRDVLAGCAGVLAVAAAIGLPRAPAPALQQAPLPAQHYVLLPAFSKAGPRFKVVPGTPPTPSVPGAKITTAP